MEEVIKELTPKQLVQLEEHKNEWLKIGQSTDPMDKRAAAEAISELYRMAGKEPPEFVFLPSPMGVEVAINTWDEMQEVLDEMKKESATKFSQWASKFKDDAKNSLFGSDDDLGWGVWQVLWDMRHDLSENAFVDDDIRILLNDDLNNELLLGDGGGGRMVFDVIDDALHSLEGGFFFPIVSHLLREIGAGGEIRGVRGSLRDDLDGMTIGASVEDVLQKLAWGILHAGGNAPRAVREMLFSRGVEFDGMGGLLGRSNTVNQMQWSVWQQVTESFAYSVRNMLELDVDDSVMEEMKSLRLSDDGGSWNVDDEIENALGAIGLRRVGVANSENPIRDMGYDLWRNIGIKTLFSVYRIIKQTLVDAINEFNKKLTEKLKGKEFEYHYTGFWGAQDAFWVAFYLFPEKYLGIKYSDSDSKQLHLFEQIAKSCGWWWPYGGLCFVSDRPEFILKDDEGQLHNDDGPAFRYRDGWSGWFIHGIRVTQTIVEHPDCLTRKDILGEENAEIRRIMVDRFGADNLVSDDDMIAGDDYGTLYRINMDEDEDVVLCRVVDGTPLPDGSFEVYWLQVPPDMLTAHQAVAWTYHKTVEEYNPRIRT